MASSVLRKMEQAAKKSERMNRSRSQAAQREAKIERRRRSRNLDVVGNTLGLDYQIVDQMIQPKDFPSDLTAEMKKKVLKKAARQAGNHVKKAIIAQIRAEGLDSRKTGSRQYWSESQRAYHEDQLNRKHLVQSIKVKVIDDKQEARIVVLVGPDSRKNAWYAWFLEFGWVQELWGTGVSMAQAPTFFMTKAIKTAGPEASKVFVDKMKEFMAT